ncbi:unnamed protein product [Urochloa decumbens]|uniref:Protein FAR1-RELATED SEQUENCE n=1 Tax=Urochloa decumbens TaxID=240449 RepID=A0ABC9C252_9POAL
MTTTVYEKWEEAKKCYNKYAKKVRFSLKIGSSKKKEKEGETDKVVLVCNRIGKNKEEKGDGPVVKQRKRNKTEKTGCTARLIVNKQNDGKWHVTTFNEDHNHPLCGKFDLKKFLRSQRGIPDEEKRFVEVLHEANITAGRYMKIQEKICCDEEENEFTSDQKVPSVLFSGYPIEEQACKFYTRKIYYKFQLELKLSTSYKITEVSGSTYTLTPTKSYVFGYGMRDYMVFADVGAKIYACECSKMKRDGILCCHILKIMTQEYIEEIPAEYLLRRWSNEAGMIPTDLAQNQTNIGAEATPLSEGVQGGKQTMKTIRYVDMCAEFAKIAKNASTNEKTTGIVRKHMDDMRAELLLFKEKNSKRQKTVAAQDSTGQPKEKSKKVKDPPAAKPKGRPISTRRKPGCRLQEKKKKEKCGICGLAEHTSDRVRTDWGRSRNKKKGKSAGVLTSLFNTYGSSTCNWLICMGTLYKP